MKRRLRHWICALACAAPLGLAARPSAAWNQSGHMQIAALAYDQLPAPVQQRLGALLRQHPRFAEDFQAHLPADVTSDAERARWFFLWASVWPDALHGQAAYERRTWHYVDFPISLHAGELATCPAARAAYPEVERRLAEKRAQHARPRQHRRKHHRPPPSASSDPGAELTPSDLDEIRPAFAWAERTLANAAAPGPQRALALSWLLHLAGDAHQPLHAVSLFTEHRFENGDRGGNDILVRGRGPLHHAWDDALGDDTSLAAVEGQSQAWRRDPELSALGRAAQKQLALDTWLDEDCALARRAVYSPAVLAGVRAVEDESSSRKPDLDLDRQYFEAARAASRRRAVQAGYRLAALLERMFAEPQRRSSKAR